MLSGKVAVLGITGGIAAYKAADVASRLKKLGCDVRVVMTRAAAEFITPLTMRTISQNSVALDMFSPSGDWEIGHISLAQAADVLLIAPATANVIGKMAAGIADDLLTTTVLAAKCPVVIAPAMNSAMYENPIVRENIEKLMARGYIFVEPESGLLACGDEGRGRLANPEVLVDEIVRLIAYPKDLKGVSVLVTAGATREEIDPVRFITNHSSGKMGYALARAAVRRGAEVVLVSGVTALPAVRGARQVTAVSAEDMRAAVLEHFPKADIVIKAAAVGDFTPEEKSGQKIKREGPMTLKLAPTRDILAELGGRAGDKTLVGFCMETQNLKESAAKKLLEKGADMIVANDLTLSGAGFGTDTNTVLIMTAQGGEDIPNMSKDELSHIILSRAAALRLKKQRCG